MLCLDSRSTSQPPATTNTPTPPNTTAPSPTPTQNTHNFVSFQTNPENVIKTPQSILERFHGTHWWSPLKWVLCNQRGTCILQPWQTIWQQSDKLIPSIHYATHVSEVLWGKPDDYPWHAGLKRMRFTVKPLLLSVIGGSYGAEWNQIYTLVLNAVWYIHAKPQRMCES